MFVAEHALEGDKVGPAHEVMGGEAVAQGVDAALLGDSGEALGLLVRPVNGVGAEMVSAAANEEPWDVGGGEAFGAPVGLEFDERTLWQDRVAVLVAFGLFDANPHRGPVNMTDFETGEFADP